MLPVPVLVFYQCDRIGVWNIGGGRVDGQS